MPPSIRIREFSAAKVDVEYHFARTSPGMEKKAVWGRLAMNKAASMSATEAVVGMCITAKGYKAEIWLTRHRARLDRIAYKPRDQMLGLANV